MSTYAIGDIQGCLPALKCLLDKIDFSADADRLWLAGDLINRGGHCLDTLRFLYNIKNSITCVLGNHDLHLLAVAEGVRKPGRSDTLDAILQAPDRNELLNWLREQPLLHRDQRLGYTMTHAGIPPIWDLDTAEARAKEVEAALRSNEAREFYANMYGNEPDGWSESLTGMTRLRVITNYFTRMRFCTEDSRLDFASKGDPADPPNGFKPWFLQPNRKTEADRLIFGHWAALNGNSGGGNLVALDTGCVWGNRLTAFRLEDRQFFHCDCSVI